ncbi:type VII secretion system-associated protein [Nocardia sp. alder85J]|uniref:type VII secretion system-associated protein n=1 Tax=Nocardia sp. alder85J TaxID=2862949 RepID=UPI001CD5872E|nr:type VII secretion system-associated protein [Nocardia sp. alder85J]MCX4095531.1 type VII secretion system-associated protein [Nocardia sp. alder85J]
MTADPSNPRTRRQGNWFVLVDPAWNTTAVGSPPVEMIVGGWMLDEDGTTRPFQPNPGYRPSTETAPSDPVDAVLRRISAGENRLGEELLTTLRDTVVEIGCDEHKRPLIGSAPDGVDCVVVATAELQKAGIDADRWVPVHGRLLPDIIPPGADILINPNGRAPFRLATDTLKPT